MSTSFYASPTPQQQSRPVQFQGLTTTLLKQAPLGQRVLGNMVNIKEGANGLSHVTAAQDTMVALLPKLSMSRSLAELSESTLLELVESTLVYYAVPLGGRKILKPLFRKLASLPVDDASLTQKLSTLSALQQQRVLPVKAAIIIASLGLALVGEYLVNYGKVLMTARVFHQDRFSDVVNLSDSKHPDSKPTSTGSFGAQALDPQASSQAVMTDSAVVRKYQDRMKTCGLTAGGLLLGTALLAGFGHRTGPLQPLLNKVLRPFVQTFDFKFARNGVFGLQRPQMLAFMALSIPAYLDACRDKLERMEVATRLAIVMPYLAFGQPFLEKRLFQLLKKRNPAVASRLLKQTDNGKSHVKSLEELSQEALQHTIQQMSTAQGSTGTTSQTLLQQPEVVKAVYEDLRPVLKAKSLLFGVPLALGVLGAGLGVGLVNRFWTRYRFEHGQANQTTPTRRLTSQRLTNRELTSRRLASGATQPRVGRQASALSFAPSATPSVRSSVIPSIAPSVMPPIAVPSIVSSTQGLPISEPPALPFIFRDTPDQNVLGQNKINQPGIQGGPLFSPFERR